MVAFGVFLTAWTGLAETKSPRFNENFLDAINLPAEQQDWWTKGVIQKLTNSLVPTPQEADQLALAAFIRNPGLDARERLLVTGLYYIGLDVPGFAQDGDLFWEIHVVRSHIEDGTTGVIWISTTTKATKILFSTETVWPRGDSAITGSSTNASAWGEAVGGFQMAASVDE